MNFYEYIILQIDPSILFKLPNDYPERMEYTQVSGNGSRPLPLR